MNVIRQHHISALFPHGNNSAFSGRQGTSPPTVRDKTCRLLSVHNKCDSPPPRPLSNTFRAEDEKKPVINPFGIAYLITCRAGACSRRFRCLTRTIQYTSINPKQKTNLFLFLRREQAPALPYSAEFHQSQATEAQRSMPSPVGEGGPRSGG